MNDDSRVLAQPYRYDLDDQAAQESGRADAILPPTIPDYLEDTYWWAYLHPWSLWFFERHNNVSAHSIIPPTIILTVFTRKWYWISDF